MNILIIYAVFAFIVTLVFMLKYWLNVTGFKSRFRKQHRHHKSVITLAAIGVFIVWPLVILFMILDLKND